MIGNKSLADRISATYEKDQDMRLRAFKERWPRSRRIRIRDMDARHREWMKKVVSEHGWPTFDLVGKRAAHKFWLLAQHMDEDKKFQEQCLEMMERAFEGGQAYPRDLAMLTDRVMLNKTGKQKYGTQFRLVDGRREPYPIVNRKHVNERRKKMGLGDLESAIEEMNKYV